MSEMCLYFIVLILENGFKFLLNIRSFVKTKFLSAIFMLNFSTLQLKCSFFFLVFFFAKLFYCPINIVLSLMTRLGSLGIIKLILQIFFLLHIEETFLNKYTYKHPLCNSFIQYMCTVFFKIKCYKHGSNNETV